MQTNPQYPPAVARQGQRLSVASEQLVTLAEQPLEKLRTVGVEIEGNPPQLAAQTLAEVRTTEEFASRHRQHGVIVSGEENLTVQRPPGSPPHVSRAGVTLWHSTVWHSTV